MKQKYVDFVIDTSLAEIGDSLTVWEFRLTYQSIWLDPVGIGWLVTMRVEKLEK